MKIQKIVEKTPIPKYKGFNQNRLIQILSSPAMVSHSLFHPWHVSVL